VKLGKQGESSIKVRCVEMRGKEALRVEVWTLSRQERVGEWGGKKKRGARLIKHTDGGSSLPKTRERGTGLNSISGARSVERGKKSKDWKCLVSEKENIFHHQYI